MFNIPLRQVELVDQRAGLYNPENSTIQMNLVYPLEAVVGSTEPEAELAMEAHLNFHPGPLHPGIVRYD